MKILYRLLGTAILSTALTAFCADPPAPGAPATAPKTAEPKPKKEVSAVQKDMQAIVTKIMAKIKEGKRSEKDLAPELQEFDALLASHKGEQTDEVAQVLKMKTILYLQIIDDSSKALELARQLKKDFPNTSPGKSADALITQIEKGEEAKKIQSKLIPGSKFPEFTEKDLEGKPLSIAGYKGKVLLVDFWATWCGPCVQELPNVLSTYEKHNPHGFDIVGISLDDSESKLKAFIASKKMPWRQYFDGKGWGNKLAEQYGVKSIPDTFLLDKEGNIIAKGLRGEDLEKAVAEAIAKK